MKIILQEFCSKEIEHKLLEFLQSRYRVTFSSSRVIALDHDMWQFDIENLSKMFPIIKGFSQSDWPMVESSKSILDEFTIIAGPCSVESHAQMDRVAQVVAASGAKILRGGVFKPRTSTYDFQGVGIKGLKIMSDVAKHYGLRTISEIMCISQLQAMEQYVDIFQVGARNMQNFSLLRALGSTSKPVLLKRSACATYNEFLSAAEYILAWGNSQVILCERGIKSFEPMTRNTLDLSVVPILKQITDLPIIVDPSHAVGIRAAVPALARAAAAVGAHGIMLEVHPEPDLSISDAKQALSLSVYSSVVEDIKKLLLAIQ